MYDVPDMRFWSLGMVLMCYHDSFIDRYCDGENLSQAELDKMHAADAAVLELETEF